MSKKNRKEKEEERANLAYTNYILELNTSQRSNDEAYDKAILSLSSASLVLSISFIRFLVPLNEASYICLLLLSWLLFFIAISTTIYSFRLSNKVLSEYERAAPKYFLDGQNNAFDEAKISGGNINFINNLSGYFFVSAMFSLILFSIINIQGTNMTQDKHLETNGASAPKMVKKQSESSLDKGKSVPFPVPPPKKPTKKDK